MAKVSVCLLAAGWSGFLSWFFCGVACGAEGSGGEDKATARRVELRHGAG